MSGMDDLAARDFHGAMGTLDKYLSGTLEPHEVATADDIEAHNGYLREKFYRENKAALEEYQRERLAKMGITL
jgi:hypothetical protein